MRDNKIEQPIAFRAEKRVNYSEERIVVNEAGEVLKQQTLKGYTTKSEPGFVKLYYDTMKSFKGLEKIPTDLLVTLSAECEGFSDAPGKHLYFRYDQLTKRNMTKALGIKESMLNKYIARLKESGTLVKTDMRGIYYVNPWILGRGEWQYISELRAHFNVVNGEWRIDLFSTTEYEEAEEPEQIPQNTVADGENFNGQQRIDENGEQQEEHHE